MWKIGKMVSLNISSNKNYSVKLLFQLHVYIKKDWKTLLWPKDCSVALKTTSLHSFLPAIWRWSASSQTLCIVPFDLADLMGGICLTVIAFPWWIPWVCLLTSSFVTFVNCLYPLSISKLDCLSFSLIFRCSLYAVNTNSLPATSDTCWKYPLPFCGLFFPFVQFCLLLCRSFKLYCSKISQSFLCGLCFCVSLKKSFPILKS